MSNVAPFLCKVQFYSCNSYAFVCPHACVCVYDCSSVSLSRSHLPTLSDFALFWLRVVTELCWNCCCLVGGGERAWPPPLNTSCACSVLASDPLLYRRLLHMGNSVENYLKHAKVLHSLLALALTISVCSSCCGRFVSVIISRATIRASVYCKLELTYYRYWSHSIFSRI